MEDLGRILEARHRLRFNAGTWKSFLSAPAWFRDRVMALDFQEDSDEQWEFSEAVLTEALHDGESRDTYFISILEDCDTRYRLEADFGLGKFYRESRPGNIIVGDEQEVRSLQGVGPFHTLMVFVQKSVADEFFREVTQSERGMPEPLLRSAFRDEKLRNVAKRLFHHFRQPPQPGRRMMKEYLQNQILERLLVVSGVQLHTPSREDMLQPTRLVDILEFIRANFAEDLSLNKLAAQAGVSRSHFVRLFRQSTGESPKQYLLKLRLERAKELLTGSQEINISEIARSCGFYDQSHLTRVLKQSYGITPTMLRRGRLES